MKVCHRQRARGVALITVMFIMVLLTTLVVYLIEDEHLSIRRVSNQQESEQGFHIAVYAEQWARLTLENDARENRTDHLEEDWRTTTPVLRDGDTAGLRVEIEDLQGRFNLNNLANGRDQVWYPAFQRLLMVLDLEPGLADAVVDWVDADIDVSGHYGAEDPAYQLKEPPYRAANRPMAEVSELAWVQGVTRKFFGLCGPMSRRSRARTCVSTSTPQVPRCCAF
jgi:general secretion pathway protein K